MHDNKIDITIIYIAIFFSLAVLRIIGVIHISWWIIVLLIVSPCLLAALTLLFAVIFKTIIEIIKIIWTQI